MSQAPVLVLAMGNPSRGDDAIGPLLAERLERWLKEERIEGVEVVCDLQLHIEHMLDVRGRRWVLFVDAAASGMTPYALHDLKPARDDSWTTHRLTPGGLLYSCSALGLPLPGRVELLAVRGYDFELGAPLSHPGRTHLESAWRALSNWCTEAVCAEAVVQSQ